MNSKQKRNVRNLFIFLLVIAITAILFWLDDLTGIGQVLDPIEFFTMALIGLFGGKIILR